jgi:hypothetical protein
MFQLHKNWKNIMIIIIEINLHGFKKKMVFSICTQFASIGVLITN